MVKRSSEHLVRVACIQHECGESTDQNVDLAMELTETAAENGAQIVCLQELFAHQYFPGTGISKEEAIDRFAEPINGAIMQRLRKVARDLRIVLVGGSIYEAGTGKDAGKYFNSAPIIDANGDVLDVHRKAHIPNDPGYNELLYFDRGDRLVTVAETTRGKIGVAICFDQWFDAVPRSAKNQGASLLLYPTAIGDTDPSVSGYVEGDTGFWNEKLSHVLSGDAARHSFYIGLANRIGNEDHTRFFGGSAIYNHVGRPLHKQGTRRKGFAMAECDFNTVPVLRNMWAFDDAERTDLKK